MDHLRQQARSLFLHRVKIRSDKCQVFEIWGSGSTVIHSERVMPTNEVPAYLKHYSGVPVFKLVQFPVRIFYKSHRLPYQQLAWVPDILTDLGIEPYMIGLLTRGLTMFEAVEKDSRELGKVLSIFMNGIDSRMLASYNFATKSTTCLLFTLEEKGSNTQYECMAKFLRRSASLYQSSCFLPLLILTDHVSLVLDGFGTFFGYDLQHVKETNLHDWETSRTKLRWAKHYNHLARDIAGYLRKKLDEDVTPGTSMSPQDIAIHAQIRDALHVLELTINPAARGIEWHLQRNEDHMGQISRKMMRQDTMASIKLSGASIELAKMATFDSSSMKVIAAMTMIFLPGMFFASLFSVPLLHWDQEEGVVGDNFWVYWAFTIPSTVLIVILWLVITQRKRMRGLYHVGKC
ncbi:uncharacterized protein F4817DRAFT_315209 [Daldinia loculata]|uniref:uncharacterized protein n=1 Tax=Daldinia loculata TaxID=103429 RepID=UPI0020C540BC|nr:uncharacterized protein F4817DRAFT_315209 [Daldinia loculata]KAI1647966.1 hypothetical protein F4817DRAFT_315209 [Daldinia loculata]